MWITFAIAASALVLAGFSLRRMLQQERKDVAIRAAAVEAGLTEPVSLHPRIDPDSCIGSGACVETCPEHDVLGMIDGKAGLIEPTACIGHGACREACPTTAIELVFGTEKRGVDIPLLKPDYETNVAGIFIAGELGGMGLIRNAVEQGRQAMESIGKLDGIGDGDCLDVVIVGAGPAGFAASLSAMEQGLRFVTLEQDALGGTVAHYPRRKLVMTQPARLPLVGKMPFRETTKEDLLDFWREIERRVGLEVRYHERVEHVERNDELLRVHSTRGDYRTRAVLLAIGRRGTPRTLDVPGEEQTKVVYRLIEPEQYRDQRVLVVGGGDSALEAALAVAQEPGTSVSLSYRGRTPTRAKRKNREKFEQITGEGRLQPFLGSSVRRILSSGVELEQDGRLIELPNDAVIVCAGGVLPTPFLTKLGVAVETKYGSR